MSILFEPQNIIDGAIVDIKKESLALESPFLAELEAFVLALDSTGGTLTGSAANRKKVAEFEGRVKKMLENIGYQTSVVKDFVANYDDLELAQKELHSFVNNIDLTKAFISPYKSWSINNVLANLEGTGLDVGVIEPLQAGLFDSVARGGRLTDLITSLRETIISTNASAGLLTRHVSRASRDALNQYDGSVNNAVRIAFDFDALIYVGSLVRDSRPQCKRWVNYKKNGERGLLKFTDLPAEITYMEKNGTGKIKGTTPDNFMRNRGGHNCRHNAIPVRLGEQLKKATKKNKPPKPKERKVSNLPPVTPRTGNQLKPTTTGVPEASVETFTPLKTLKAAEAWARKNNLASTVNFKGAKLEIVNSWLETVYNTFKQFPELRDNMQFLGVTQERNLLYIERQAVEIIKANPAYFGRFSDAEALKRAKKFARKSIGNTGANNIAVSLTTGRPSTSYINGISLNKKFAKNVEAYKKILKDSLESSWFAHGGDELAYIVNHELGHEIDKLVNLRTNPKFLKIFKRETAKGQKHIKENLSLYAWKGKNPKAEFIAEAWAEFTTAEKPRAIAKEIGELILELYDEQYKNI